MRLILLVAAWCCVSPAFGLGQAIPPKTQDLTLAKNLTDTLEQARQEMNMPGVRAAVRFADGRIVQAAVGLADVEQNIPLDNSVGMPGGSTGKTFVAALAMLLVEQGALDLDAPVSRWLGDRKWFNRLPNADTMRVRDLMSHSAGIADYPGTVSFQTSMVWRVLRHGSAYYEPEELMRFAFSRRPLYTAGEGYRYTDVGYLVLGRVIEAASGRDYFDLLGEQILDPLQLTEIRPQIQSALPGITPGYTLGTRNLKKDGRMKLDPRSEWTGGGLVTNPTMLVQFFGALAEGRVVSKDSLQEMLSAGWRDPKNPDWHYGLGLFVAEDQSYFLHGGLWSGYRTYITHYMDTGVTVAVQTNRDGKLDLRGLVDQIAALADLDRP